MEDDSTGAPPQRPESLLPYEAWTEEALRFVVVRALSHVAAEGLPGDHHFYISFRTDSRGVSVPQRLRSQYPHEMTIVLQHQFWDLKVEQGVSPQFSVGLSFGGVPTTLTVPFSAITGFADPHVQFGLRFRPQGDEPANDMVPEEAEAPAEAEPEPAAPPSQEEPQVVSLDAFRKRPPSKEQ
jgi:hypothetical protein